MANVFGCGANEIPIFGVLPEADEITLTRENGRSKYRHLRVNCLRLLENLRIEGLGTVMKCGIVENHAPATCIASFSRILITSGSFRSYAKMSRWSDLSPMTLCKRDKIGSKKTSQWW